VHEGYLVVYVDAVECVELPNVISMSQYADGGKMASKPCVTSGRYIQRMSNDCKGCCFDLGEAVGDCACPFTTLYLGFLRRHHERFVGDPRTAQQWLSLARFEEVQQGKTHEQAKTLRQQLGGWH